eukprot:TRINITY_DN8003_c0_g1_i1.p1 TRINITY_DN8003_c0_g1~~TRINITY_DN8003_c0_g1_i1.p1  ORF type:complete len:322 (-),score=50.60 TRINITY_DN8003_c0_g1_i1:119-1084(-)
MKTLFIAGLLLLFLCAFHPGSSEVTGKLLGFYFNFSAPNDTFSLWELDPLSGSRLTKIFEADWSFLGSLQITKDNKQNVFFPILSLTLGSIVIGLNLSSSIPEIICQVQLPYSVVSMEFDTKTSTLIVIQLAQDHASIAYIDPYKGSYSTVANFTSSFFPAYFGFIPGGTCAIYPPKNLFVFPTMTVLNQSFEFYVSTMDLISFEIRNFKQTDLEAAVMKFWDGELVTIITNGNQNGLSWGYFDFEKGVLVKKFDYHLENFVFVVGGIGTVSPPLKVLYTVLGNGKGPPVALTRVNLDSGLLEGYSYFISPHPQPTFLLQV